MTDSDTVADRLEMPAEAATIRDEQVQRALGRLDDCGGLTPHQRETVERLADRLTVALLDMFDADGHSVDDVDAGEGTSRALLCQD